MNKSIVTLSVIAISAITILEGCKVEFRRGDRGWHRPGYGHGHRHPRRRHWMVSDTIELARSYSISLDSANTILELTSGENQKEQLAALGLDVSDVSSLANLEMPSRESVDKVALALNEQSISIERLMADFVRDIKAEDASNQNEGNY